MIVFCLIACLFLTVSGVSAATLDDNSTQVGISTDADLVSVGTLGVSDDSSSSAENTSVLGSSDDGKSILSATSSVDVNNFQELKEAVSSGDKTINIKNNITVTSTLTFGGDNIVINGNGYTLTGNNARLSIFYIQDKQSITLKNINVINVVSYTNLIPTTYAPRTCGGAFNFINCTNVDMDNVNFKNIKQTTKLGNALGAAIVIAAGSGFNFKNCFFDNCTTIQSGGAIEFIGCDLGYTLDDGKSGARLFSDNVIMTNLTFTNCYAASNGGAVEIYVTNSVWSNCTFINNTASTSSGALGVWQGENNTIINCKFINSTSTNYGGALATQSTALNTQIINCTFINSVSKNNAGGAIYFVAGNSSIINCTFNNNTAKTSGGAVYFNAANSTINGSIFTNNRANCGGAVFFNGDNCSISFSTFEDNNATTAGGAVYSSAEGSTVQSSTFKNNTAPDGANFKAEKGIKFIGLEFDELYLCNTEGIKVEESHGTSANDPASWTEENLGFLIITGQTTISTHTNK